MEKVRYTKIVKKICAWLLCAVLLSAGMTFDAQASEISSIRLTVTHHAEEGVILEPTIESVSSDYEITDISYSKSVDNWKAGQRVTVTVTLSATGSKTWADSYKSSKISISTRNDGSYRGTDCENYSARVEGDGTVEVSFRYYPIVKLSSTAKAGWTDATKTKASWRKVQYATNYEVKLYDEEGILKKTIDTSQTTHDFSSSMVSNKMYYYTVQAKGKDTAERKYLIDGEIIESDETVVDDMGEIGGSFHTSSSGITYRGEDGNYVKNDWRQIDGKWYYFNADGHAVSGWLQTTAGLWYYMNEDGSMFTGWLLDKDSNWYYLGQDGSLKIGWYETDPGYWYYSYPTGVMAKSTTVDGYRIDSNGRAEY